MGDEDRNLIVVAQGSEQNETNAVPVASTVTSSEESLGGSMVIYVHQEQTEELTVPVLTTTGSSNITESQLITIVPQNFTDGVGDTLPSLATSPAHPHTIHEDEIGGEVVTNLLGPSVSDDSLFLQQRTGAFRTEDGQLIYVTYTVYSTLEEIGTGTSNNPTESETSQRMGLHVTDDRSTIMVPAESVEVGELDVNESGILSQFTVNGVYSIVENSTLTEVANGSLTEGSLTSSVVQTYDKNEEAEGRFVLQPLTEICDRRHANQVIGSELHIEKKLEVLDAMLTPAPERCRKKKSQLENEEVQGCYMCDICETIFPRASQFYGHLHSHSGERKWECNACPGKVVFASQSQLRRHEKECHLNLRPHACSVCSARYDRVSQLNYHKRRIHGGERGHDCKICHKAFFKRSDLKTHLNIHLGINKCICETCGKKFNHVSNLIRHSRMHTGVKPYPCNICGRRFSQLNALHQHKTSHQTNKDVACTICRKMFKSYMVMRKHVRQLHGDKLAESGKDANVMLKMKEGVQSRRFYCKVCGENFEFGALLKQHELQHEKEKNFHCNCCGQDYDTVQLLKTHSCVSPEEKLQKELEEEAEAERLALSTQLECLLQDHEEIAGEAEGRNNANGNADIMNSVIIYVTQEGQDEPTQVHIEPMNIPVLSDTDKRKSLVLLSRADLEKQQQVQQVQTSKIVFVEDARSNCQSTTEVNKTLTEALHMEICTAGVTPHRNSECINSSNSGGTTDDINRTDCNNTSLLYQQLTKSLTSENNDENFVPGAVGEPIQESNCDNGASRMVVEASTLPHKVMEQSADILPTKPQIANEPSQLLDPLSAHNTNTPKGTPPVLNNGKKQVRIYQCPECPKTFVKNSNFKQHLGIHFIEQQRYHCPTCGQTFAWKSTLNKHILVHSTVPLPRYRCDLCSKEYAAATQVQEHIKRDHYKQRPHACVVCNKTFYKRYDLKIHLRTHTKERPYICGTCGKSFYHLSHIIRHERIHSGQRPYHCPDCGRRFNQSSSLKSHRQRHSQCKNKTVLAELTQPELVQPAFPDIESDTVLLYAGATL